MAQSSSSPPRSSPGCLLIGVIGILSFFCGVFAGRGSASGSQSNNSASLSWEITQLRQAVGKLESEFKLLRTSVSTAPGAPLSDPSTSPTRQAVGADARFEALVQRIEKALRELDSMPASTTAKQRSTGLGRSSLEEIRGAFDLRGSTPEDYDTFVRELTQAHLLWTVDDVIERYGMPRRTGVANGPLTFFYAFGTDERLYPRPSARFVFQDGRVTHVEVDE